MELARSKAPRRDRRWRRRPFVVLLLAVLVIVGIPMADYLSLYLDNPVRPSLRSHQTWMAVPKMALAIPAYYRDAAGRGPDIETIELEVEARELQTIVDKRANALRVGVLFSSRQDLVPAVLRHRGRALGVQIRLKGDLRDHWAGSRWSLRVEVDDDGRGEGVLGMRRFSLHAPWARGFHREPLFLDVLRSYGFLAPRADIVEVSLNGRQLGLMEIEGHVGSDLLSQTSRPAGVFLKLDEDRLWREWVATAEELGVPWSINTPKPEDANNWRKAPIDAFESKAIRASEPLSRNLTRATELLQGVMDNRLPPSQVFDAERWGAYLAHCEIFGATHMVLWNNLRFYFDPTTDRLEPVAFDTGVLPERQRQPLATGVSLDCVGGELAFTTSLVADPVIRSAVMRALRNLDDQVHGEDLEDLLKQREARYLGALHTEYPWLESFDLEAVRRRAAELRRVNEGNLEDLVRVRLDR